MSIEELIRETLDDRATHVTADDNLAVQIVRRARGRRGRRAALGIFAVVIVVIVVVLTFTQTLPHTTRVAPDPRATAVPSLSPRTPAASIPGLVTTYPTVQGPAPRTAAAAGTAIAVSPRVERRGTTTWLVTQTSSVALPASVNGARSIQSAGSSWIVFTVSSDYTGGDTDPGARILVVSSSGAVRSLVTDDVRSIALSPDGTQIASVETVETRTVWSVTLIVRRIADGAVIRKVPLPYGSRGEWPYEALSWTTDGIVASNQSGSITVAGATVLVRDKTVTDEAPITGMYRVPLSIDGYVTSASGGSTCLSFSASSTTTPATSESILCGRVGSITVLSSGLGLVLFTDTDGSQAVVADPVSRKVTVLTVPPEVYTAALVGAVAEGATTVLVPDYTTKTWWRWDVVANTVETAPLPSGAKAAISW
jgi:hypothetical protein